MHIGTGNYNRATAQVYTDFGLFTANPRIAADASEVFNYLTGYSKQTTLQGTDCRAGRTPRPARGDREIEHARAGRPAGIIIKNNAISDPGIIQALYRASHAGVPIRAIVRGICCLRPGIPGISETIEVRIDRRPIPRALSRVYYFENGGEPYRLSRQRGSHGAQSGSARRDAVPVLDRDIARFIRDTMLEAYLFDTERASSCAPTDCLTATAGAAAVDARRLLASRP